MISNCRRRSNAYVDGMTIRKAQRDRFKKLARERLLYNASTQTT